MKPLVTLKLYPEYLERKKDEDIIKLKLTIHKLKSFVLNASKTN